MSFHYTNLGMFGEYLPHDLDGFVPEEGDLASSFCWGHTHFTSDFDKQGNGWEGYADECWSEFKAEAIRKTKIAESQLDEWRQRR